MRPLPRSFYLRPTLTVAKDLLGKYLVRKLGRELLIGRIVEVEAYLGTRDPASHAYRGRTKRNDVMFWAGGHLYVYFTYGMHFCANVVTGPDGIGEAVLLRAVEPVEGIERMTKNRLHGNLSVAGAQRNLTSGPAKLCEAFAIGRRENGTDLMHGEIMIAAAPGPKPRIASSKRIGIRAGTEFRWRFYIRNNTWVSRKN
ncbi:MAG: DNA-3-methyladenine glycosylase [Ignavibacteriales bacterium]|nr:DNA-3-methyladenine glycosylase [Ignavibacteriales bacterium]